MLDPGAAIAINDYYKLKTKYESDIHKIKRKLINNQSLSWKERKSEFTKFKPKCVNCNKPGGTIFASKYNKDGFRELTAMCGNKIEPCKLDISINSGKYDLIPNVLREYEKDVRDAKTEIITNKNELLFGYKKAETVLERFNELKEYLSDATSLLEMYLDLYYNITDNKEVKQNLKEMIEKSYDDIASIKQSVVNYNTTNSTQYINGAVELYVNSLKPSLDAILKLKYKENMVWYDENNNTYHLLQYKYGIKNVEIDVGNHEAKVQRYTVGFQEKKKETKRVLVRMDNEDEEEKGNENENMREPNKSEMIPTFNADGTVTWSNTEYQSLWNSLNKKVQTALLTDHEWVQEFVANCVTLRAAQKPCEFKNPSNLIIPPQIIDDDKYDFGNEVYNNLFNKYDKTYQNTLLSLFSTKDGVKKYTMLEHTLSSLLSKELGYRPYV